jgi:hypothetical protein
LEVCASIAAQKDNNTSLKSIVQEMFKVWDVTLKNLWKKLQIPSPGPFNMADIPWEEKTNQE